MPATFTIAPSGARLPLRPTTPPVGDSGLSAGTHHVLVGIPFHALEILRDGAAGDRHAVAVQVAVIEEGFHQEWHAASFEQILGDITAARFQIRDVRCPFEDFGDVEQVEHHSAFVRNRRQVQCRIGRAARGGHHRRGVLQRLAGDDVARTDLAGDQLHHLLAGKRCRTCRGIRTAPARRPNRAAPSRSPRRPSPWCWR